MRLPWIPLLILLVGAVLASPAPADEIVLETGAVLRGTVEDEGDDEVVIRTDIGLMRFPRKMVREVRREEAAAAPETVNAGLVGRIQGIRPQVRPVAAGNLVLVADVAGGVRAVNPGTGKRVWASAAGGMAVTGIAADPGGAYVAAGTGSVSRLDLRSGQVMWTTELGDAAVRGAPLLLRRGVFVFAPGIGLFGLDQANGKIRGVLKLKFTLDNPLSSVGDLLLLCDPDGQLLVVGEGGTKLLGGYESASRWAGRPLAMSLKSVLLGGRENFVIFDPRRGKLVRQVKVPGLYAHPLGGDAGRAFVNLDGALTALDIQTGRILFKSPGAGRVTSVAVTGRSIFATTADSRLARVSLANGEVIWSVPIGGRPVAPPLVIGERILVSTLEGTCMVFSETAGSAPEPVEPAEEREPEPPAESGSGGVLHSPAGYRVTVPDGWELSEDVIRGEVTLGFRPVRTSSRFASGGKTAEDLHRLSLTAHLLTALLRAPVAGASSPSKAWIDRERIEASRGGYQVKDPATKEVERAGRAWTEASVVLEIPGSPPRRVHKRAAFSPVDGNRTAQVELRIPLGYREAGDADFEAVVSSLVPESDFEPTRDVLVAQDVLEALNRGDVASVLERLAEPVRKRAEESPPETGRARYRLLELGSTRVGRFHEVRVRVDDDGSTRFASVLLAEEAEQIVVVGWRTLFHAPGK